jgi:hypothetical protein
MTKPLPNRLALYLGTAVAIIAGIIPIVTNADWESTGGIIAALLAIVALLDRWLKGWQMYEPELTHGEPADPLADVDPEPLLEDFIEEEAEPIPQSVKVLPKDPKTVDPTDPDYGKGWESKPPDPPPPVPPSAG